MVKLEKLKKSIKMFRQNLGIKMKRYFVCLVQFWRPCRADHFAPLTFGRGHLESGLILWSLNGYYDHLALKRDKLKSIFFLVSEIILKYFDTHIAISEFFRAQNCCKFISLDKKMNLSLWALPMGLGKGKERIQSPLQLQLYLKEVVVWKIQGIIIHPNLLVLPEKIVLMHVHEEDMDIRLHHLPVTRHMDLQLHRWEYKKWKA